MERTWAERLLEVSAEVEALKLRLSAMPAAVNSISDSAKGIATAKEIAVDARAVLDRFSRVIDEGPPERQASLRASLHQTRNVFAGFNFVAQCLDLQLAVAMRGQPQAGSRYIC